ncbi:LCP family protein [Oceanobacillus sp. CF4.6]|uniref:LCP family protein n=1 Tax=Oceanobacillus sp. CF4.6 TaxID=3373080 RepID=UPI003EE79BEA
MFTRRKKILFSILIIFLILLGSLIGYVFHLYNQTASVFSDSHEDVGRTNETSPFREGDIDPVKDNTSILFIGVDDSEHRDSEDSRSDALLLATFNKDDSSVKLLSIPRDSYVYIPEVNYSTKINHAHAYGGARATIETVEDFLRVPVDYYVRMNFNAFTEVVDALDGIEYDVPYEMEEMDSRDKQDAILLQPGLQRINGEEALALARTRKYDSDVERGRRQQEILKEVANKATSASSLFKLEDVMKAVGSNMTTNLTLPEIRGFLSYGLDKNVLIDNINLAGSGGYMENGGWYYQVEEASRAQIQGELRNHLELEPLDGSTHDTEDADRHAY